MTDCVDFKTRFLQRARVVVSGLLLVAMAACNSGQDSKSSKTAAGSEQRTVMATDNATSPGIDLNCVMEHIQNPPEAFHYSYQKQSSNPVQEEADITPQTIDGMFKNNSASQSFHGVRSDSDNWRAAWSRLMGIAGMSSAVAIIRNSSATLAEGREKVNGYDVTRYSIDTSRATVAEQGLYRSVLGPDGFEKGAAWVTSQGCPVKLTLDSELHASNGSVEKIHYEVAMVRK